jgi:hypothetical protein
MKIIVFLLVTINLLALSTGSMAMSCDNFNRLGTATPARSHDEVMNSNATHEQIDAFKKVISNHVGDLMNHRAASPQNQALQVVRKANKLTEYVRDSLMFTRFECVKRTNASFETVSVEQFDYMLTGVTDAVKELNSGTGAGAATGVFLKWVGGREIFVKQCVTQAQTQRTGYAISVSTKICNCVATEIDRSVTMTDLFRASKGDFSAIDRKTELAQSTCGAM